MVTSCPCLCNDRVHVLITLSTSLCNTTTSVFRILSDLTKKRQVTSSLARPLPLSRHENPFCRIERPRFRRKTSVCGLYQPTNASTQLRQLRLGRVKLRLSPLSHDIWRRENPAMSVLQHPSPLQSRRTDIRSFATQNCLPPLCLQKLWKEISDRYFRDQFHAMVINDVGRAKSFGADSIATTPGGCLETSCKLRLEIHIDLHLQNVRITVHTTGPIHSCFRRKQLRLV